MVEGISSDLEKMLQVFIGILLVACAKLRMTLAD
jgi:hypothetical protein